MGAKKTLRCMVVVATLLGGFAAIATSSVAAGATGLYWGQVATPSPGAASGGLDQLSSVSCVSPSDCWAVGNSTSASSNITTITIHWNGSSWALVPSPDPGGSGGTQESELYSVTCALTNECFAVGTMGDNSGGPTSNLVLEWNGASWSQVSAPSPGGTSATDVLVGATCVSNNDCWAVGQAGASPNLSTFAMQWNGTSWTQMTTPNPIGAEGALTSISCSSSSNCIAVGLSSTQSTLSAIAMQWNGSAWTSVSLPASLGIAALTSVSCPASAGCIAVGDLIGTGGYTPVALFWNGSSWSQAGTPHPGGLAGSTSFVNSVSCSSTSACVAVGATTQANGNGSALVMEWNGSGWAQNTTAMVGASSELSGTTCVVAASCWAVGDSSDTAGNTVTLAMSGTVPTQGYDEVATDGGLFTFGTANFYGSMGARPLNKPIVGIASTPNGGGYWEVASDGGIFSFGNAHFYGSLPGMSFPAHAVALLPTATGKGYLIVTAGGRTVELGDAPQFGQVAGSVDGWASTLVGGAMVDQ